MNGGGSSVVTLLAVISLVAACAALTWTLIGLPLRVARVASLRFAMGNALLLVTTLLQAQRGDAASYWYYPGSDLAMLGGLTLIRSGMQRLCGLPITHLESRGMVVLAALLLYAVAPDASSAGYRGILRSLFSGVVLLRATQECLRVLRPQFGRALIASVLLPVGLVGLFLLVRGLLVMAFPQRVGSTEMDGSLMAQTLWPLLVGALLINLSMIGLALTRLVLRARDLANRDGLTGAHNRRAATDALESERKRMLRGGPAFAVILFDLDHFKQINDRLGHAAGDAALKHAANTVGAALRQQDLLARFGGEEFMVLLPMTDLAGAAQMAERLRLALVQAPLPWAAQAHAQALALRASFGVALAHSPPDSDDALLKRADQALYAAKAGGRNQVVTEAVAS